MRIKLLSALIILAALTSCSLGKRPETSVYTLRAQAGDSKITSSCKVKSSIQIASPTNDPGLDTRRIAVLENGNKLNYYTGVRWAAPVSDMLETILVNGFEKSSAYSSVSTDSDSATSTIIIATDVRSFYVDRSTSKVHVNLVAKLIDSTSRDIIKTIPVEKVYAPEANRIESIIETFSKAANDAVADIVKSSSQKCGK